jgi:sugar lactone lactonase YvrE
MSSNHSLASRFASGIFLMLALPAVTSSPGRAQLATPNVSETVVANSDTNGLNSPGAAAVGPNGNLFIADTENNRLLEEPWNNSSKTYGAQAVLTTNLFRPEGVAVGASGNVFIADTGNNRIIEISWNQSTGSYGSEVALGSGLQSPNGVAVTPTGSVYIADTGNNRIVEIPWDRTTSGYGLQTTVASDLPSPHAVAIGEGGKVYIANTGNGSVIEIPAGCDAATSCNSETFVANQSNNGLTNPTGIAVGRTGNLYIADTGNNRLVELPWNRTTNAYGTQTTGGTNLLGPKGVAVDAVGGVYIVDTGNNRVLKIAQSPGNRPRGINGLSHMRP